MADPRMKDADKTLAERINLAIDRVTKGHGQIRIPVEATDPDVVLVDCKERIAALEAENARLKEDAERYRFTEKEGYYEVQCDTAFGDDRYAWCVGIGYSKFYGPTRSAAIDAARREQT